MSTQNPTSNRLNYKPYLILGLLALLYPSQASAGDSPVVIVGINQSSIDPKNVQSLLNQVQSETPGDTAAIKAIGLMQKSWPYPRSLYGCLVERLFQLGAKTVAIGILFPSSQKDDESFAEVLSKYPGRVILASSKLSGQSSKEAGPATLMPNKLLAEAVGTYRIGFAYMEPESDGILRRFHTHIPRQKEINDNETAGTDSKDSVSFAALAVETFTVKPISHGDREIVFPKASKKATEPEIISIESVFIDALLKKSPEYKNGRIFENKLVFIGLAADSFHDKQKTEIGLLNTVEVHAQIAKNLLSLKP